MFLIWKILANQHRYCKGILYVPYVFHILARCWYIKSKIEKSNLILGLLKIVSYFLVIEIFYFENSVVLFFNARKILTTCSSACHFHLKTVENLFRAVSEKNLNLVRKLDHLTKRSTREKLISYLSEESMKHNSPSFSIPFNRQQLADFLSVDRSAMSNELSKMRDDGLLLFDKNKFTLLRI